MNNVKGRNKKIQPEQKLSFGSALKQNVIIYSFNLNEQFKNTNAAQKSKRSGASKGSASKKHNNQGVQISRIDESYNVDKVPENLNNKEDINERKGYLQDIPSDTSSIFSAKVNIYL